MLLFTGVFGVVVSLKHPFQGHFFFGVRQHDLFNHSDVFKLIPDPRRDLYQDWSSWTVVGGSYSAVFCKTEQAVSVYFATRTRLHSVNL